MNETATIPPVFPGLFSEDADAPSLLGSECKPCERRFFPRRRYCDTCLEPAVEADADFHVPAPGGTRMVALRSRPEQRPGKRFILLTSELAPPIAVGW